jgi:hypothetical protein
MVVLQCLPPPFHWKSAPFPAMRSQPSLIERSTLEIYTRKIPRLIMGTISLFLRHQRYKSQQAKLQKWLFETVRMILQRSGTADQELQGKHMAGLAEIVRTAKPKVRVPQEIHNLVASVIYDRSIAAEAYRRKPKPEANDRHIAFIEDLKLVQASLLNLRPISATVSAKEPCKVANLFSLLKLEEPKTLPLSNDSSEETRAQRNPPPQLAGTTIAKKRIVTAVHVLHIRAKFEERPIHRIESVILRVHRSHDAVGVQSWAKESLSYAQVLGDS